MGSSININDFLETQGWSKDPKKSSRSWGAWSHPRHADKLLVGARGAFIFGDKKGGLNWFKKHFGLESSAIALPAPNLVAVLSPEKKHLEVEAFLRTINYSTPLGYNYFARQKISPKVVKALKLKASSAETIFPLKTIKNNKKQYTSFLKCYLFNGKHHKFFSKGPRGEGLWFLEIGEKYAGDRVAYIFESPLDAIAYAELQELYSDQKVVLLATCGTPPSAMLLALPRILRHLNAHDPPREP